jgi:acid phosphatase
MTVCLVRKTSSINSPVTGYIPNANGLSKASTTSTTQLDRNNKPYTTLPQVQSGVSQNLPNTPFNLEPYIHFNDETIDLTHMFYTQQMQINGGSNNKFVAYGNSQGLTMSNYDARSTFIGQLALNYTLFDAWHHALFGGSFGNHQWLITPHSPTFPNAPSDMINRIDANNNLVDPDNEVEVTPDLYAVNTIYTSNPPVAPYAEARKLLPLQNTTTIGDLLSNAGISWAWYAGGYNDAMAGRPDETYQFHHQPFAYFSKYAPGQPGRKHLQDETDLFAAIDAGTLPSVSFYKPLGKYNMHPEYSIVGGDAEVKLKQVVNKIMNSAYWNNCVIFVTFDENGGRWDHVAPPKIDRWGPGLRIPTILVSPMVKKGYVDSTYHDTTSIMRFIQQRYDLPTLGTRDAMQNGFDDVFLPASVAEMGTSFESCIENAIVAPVEKRANWQTMQVNIELLAPGNTFYGAVQLYDAPTNLDIKYLRFAFSDLSKDSVIVRVKQVHTTSDIQTKSGFFSLSPAQRQTYYKDWLPGTEPHESDITYPKEAIISSCSNSFACGYVLENPQITDQSDVLPVFLFSIQNNQSTALSGNIIVRVYAGDNQPGCRVAPVGIVLGSLWTAAIFVVIAIVVTWLVIEKEKLKREGVPV